MKVIILSYCNRICLFFECHFIFSGDFVPTLLCIPLPSQREWSTASSSGTLKMERFVSDAHVTFPHQPFVNLRCFCINCLYNDFPTGNGKIVCFMQFIYTCTSRCHWISVIYQMYICVVRKSFHFENLFFCRNMWNMWEISLPLLPVVIIVA